MTLNDRRRWTVGSLVFVVGACLVAQPASAAPPPPTKAPARAPAPAASPPAASPETAAPALRPAPSALPAANPVAGTIDATFDAKSGFDERVSAVKLFGGKIIVGGSFTTYQGVPRKGVARLLPSGALDTTFDPGAGGPNGPVKAIAVEPDGKVLIGGEFSSVLPPNRRAYQGTPRKGIARLMADATLDPSFDPGTGPEGHVESIHRLPNGKLLVGGFFHRFNGVRRQYIVRLNPNGSVDASFDAQLGPVNSGYNPPGEVQAIAVAADGKIVIAGSFGEYHGSTLRHVMRLNADGSPDTTFTPVTLEGQPDRHVASVALQTDGKVLLAGRFTKIGGRERPGIARVLANGAMDDAFVADASVSWADQTAVWAFPDGRILVGGQTASKTSTASNNVMLLWSTGGRVPHFRSSLPFFDPSFAVTDDQKVVAVGHVPLPWGGDKTRITRFWTTP